MPPCCFLPNWPTESAHRTHSGNRFKKKCVPLFVILLIIIGSWNWSCKSQGWCRIRHIVYGICWCPLCHFVDPCSQRRKRDCWVCIRSVWLDRIKIFLDPYSFGRKLSCFYWNNDLCIKIFLPQLQPNGIEKNLGLGNLTEFEKQLVAASIPELKKNIKKGEEFVQKH